MADDLIDFGQLGSGKEGLKAMVRSVYELALPTIRKKAGDIAGFAAYQGADAVTQVLKKGAEDGVAPEGSAQDTAIKIGAAVGAATNIGLALSANVTDFMGASKRVKTAIHDLSRDVEPHLAEEFGKKGSVAKLMRSKNEVIATKRTRVISNSKSDFYSAAAGLTGRLPDIYDAMVSRQEEIEGAYRGIVSDPEHYEDAAVKDGKDPEKFVEDMAGKLSPYGLVKENEARVQSKRAAAGATQDDKDKIPSRREKGKIGANYEEFLEARQNTEASLTGKFDERIYNAADSAVFASQSNDLVGNMTRGLTPFLQKTVKDIGSENARKVCAYDLIKSLEDQSLDNDVSRVMHPITGDTMGLGEYIYDVFRQHQKDVDGTQINERYGFKKELQDACDAIAEEITEQGLSPMALIGLVGDRKVLDKNLRVTEPEALEKLLSKARTTVEMDPTVDAAEYISETAFANKDDFREVLNGLPAEEKAFFASLFPTEVLREMGGLKDSEIKTLHEAAAEDFVDSMLDAVQELAKQDVETLRHSGLTEDESEMIHELADLIKESGVDSVKEELDGQTRTELSDAVRNARGYWQDRVAGKATESAAKEKDDDAKDSAEKAGFVSRLRDKGGSEADRSV